MILEALLIAAGSAVVAGAAIMTKDKDKIIQPVIIDKRIDNSVHNNNCNNNNRYNKFKLASNKAEQKIQDSYNQNTFNQDNNIKNNYKDSHNIQQSTEIDHDKIIDELYLRYKLDKNADDLNKLMEELNNL